MNDATPTQYRHEAGPSSEPTHPLVLGPIITPPHTLDGFVRLAISRMRVFTGARPIRSRSSSSSSSCTS